jgi:hypothetical protein
MVGPDNRYFAYGSNMDPDQMAFRGLEVERAVAARLMDHRLAFDFDAGDRWLGGAADVVAEEGAVVEGVLYDLRGPIEVMDPWEGVPKWYRRIPVEVLALPTGETTEAWTYEVVDKGPYIPPSEGYIGKMILAARKIGLSEGYIQGLRFHLAASLRGLEDHMVILGELNRTGSGTPEELAIELNWDPDRASRALEDLRGWGWAQGGGTPMAYSVQEGRSADVVRLLG